MNVIKLTWDIRSVYLYLISFVTLILLIVNVVNLGRGLVDVIIQPPGYYPGIEEIKMRADNEGVSLETIQKKVQLEQELNDRNARYWAIKNVVKALAFIVVVGPVYLYHWRKIRQEILT
ncbi:MAG: hypothetical protein ACYC2T_01885 [Bacillota bacterium]